MKYTFIFFSLCFLLLCSCKTETKPPNVLFIAIDDLRTELNCYGKTQIKSPNIDKLASEGMVFTRAYCQQALCGPSRLSIMTGSHLEKLGVFGMKASNIIEWRDTRKGVTSLTEQFKNNGYYAQGFGKIYDYRLGYDEAHSWDNYIGGRIPHFASPENLIKSKQRHKDRKEKKPNPQRWPAVESYDTLDETYTDGKNTSLAVDFIKDYDKDKPFFLAVGFVRPHLPFVAPKKYWDLYERDNITLPENGNPLDGFSEHTLSSAYKEIFDYDVNAPISDEFTKELRHGYYACVSYVDAQIGKLVKVLEEKGELDNTIIVIGGDHGFKLGDYGEWAKHTNLETDTRVPLLVRLPNKKGAGKRSNSPVMLVDILPTICDAAGIPIPKSADGESLIPLLTHPQKQVHKFALSQFPRGKDVMGYSIRTNDWRYTEWISRKTGEILEQELYKMEGEIPMEKENVAKLFPKETKHHNKLLHDYLNTCEKWDGEPHG